MLADLSQCFSADDIALVPQRSSWRLRSLRLSTSSRRSRESNVGRIGELSFLLIPDSFGSRRCAPSRLVRPHRNPMSPPKLAADAPVADVFVPGLERLGVAGGIEAELAFRSWHGVRRCSRNVVRHARLRHASRCVDAPSRAAPRPPAARPSPCNTTDRSNTARSARACDSCGRRCAGTASLLPAGCSCGTTRPPPRGLRSGPGRAGTQRRRCRSSQTDRSRLHRAKTLIIAKRCRWPIS